MSSLRYKSLPVWAQWLLPFTVAAALIVALVWFVHHQTDDVPAIANVNGHAAVVENQEDTVIVRQQQVPHVTKLVAGESAGEGARRAVVAFIHSQIARGLMEGPVRSSSCRTAAGSSSAREVLHCSVTASALVVTYRFDAVVDPAAARITYCQRVEPPVPSLNVPVSGRCT